MISRQNRNATANQFSDRSTNSFYGSDLDTSVLGSDNVMRAIAQASSYFPDLFTDSNITNGILGNSVGQLVDGEELIRHFDDYTSFLDQLAGDYSLELSFNPVESKLQVINPYTGEAIEIEISTDVLNAITAESDLSASSYQGNGSGGNQQYTAQSNGFSSTYGYGLVDANAAVSYAAGYWLPSYAYDGYYAYESWGIDRIKALDAWMQGYTGQGVVVAVVDSGVDFTHPDLNDNLWYNTDEYFGDGIDNDGNGYIDDVIGWDFVGNDYNPYDEDSIGHGTHVAGIIAAENDNSGIFGVAYDAKIMPVRVLDANRNGSPYDVAQGIIYAADNGADIINASLGGGYSEWIEYAVSYATQKGVLVVMSAGNNGYAAPEYPGALATNWGIVVGATDYYNDITDFSNRAGSDARMNYVVAPGQEIYSTTPGNNYMSYEGTSMAAPYVSGVAALMLSANPYLTPDQLRNIIISTAS